MKRPLHEVAHARAGDKGDRSNISVIAYGPQDWPLIREQVTVEAVAAAIPWATDVTRHELPNLMALNFVVDGALGGGVNATLALDRHGKTLSSLILDRIEVDTT